MIFLEHIQALQVLRKFFIKHFWPNSHPCNYTFVMLCTLLCWLDHFFTFILHTNQFGVVQIVIDGNQYWVLKKLHKLKKKRTIVSLPVSFESLKTFVMLYLSHSSYLSILHFFTLFTNTNNEEHGLTFQHTNTNETLLENNMHERNDVFTTHSFFKNIYSFYTQTHTYRRYRFVVCWRPF